MHGHDAAFVVELAQRVLRGPARAEQWLKRPNVQLGGRAPGDMLGSAGGRRRVEELLAQIDDDDRLGID